MSNKTEVRTFRGTALRASQGDMSIAGRALSYGTLSADLGGFKEVLVPGCFSRSLASGQIVKCLREHQDGFLLGSTKDGSLTLQDSPAGLDFSCKIDPNDPIAVSTRAAIQAGKIDSMSFAFAIDGNDGDAFTTVNDERSGEKYVVRSVSRALLLDVSPVFAPAYPQGTSVSARAVDYSVAPVSDQAPIRAQIAAFAHRRKQSLVDARCRIKEYSPLSAEDIVRCKKLGYSEDLMLELRGAAIARQIRAGYTGADFSGGFAANSPRDAYNGGAAADPTASLRDDDDDFDFDDDGDWDKSEHERAAEYHRALASKAKTLDSACAHYQAADLHSAAARQYPDLNASFSARAASKSLRQEKEPGL